MPTLLRPPPSHSLLLLLLLLVSSAFHYTARGRTTHIVANLSNLIPASTCSIPERSAGANSLRITHKYGPCSPLPTSLQRSVHDLLIEDELRFVSLQQKLLSSSTLQDSKATLPVRRGLSLHDGNYLVTVGIGTPPKDQIVAFDTGSSVCWVQCLPCTRCYSQSLPVFNPSASSSYRNVSCSATTCGELFAKGCSSGSCLYGVRYGDGSTTAGFLAQETLTLTSSDVFPDFVFGCGQQNQGLFGQTSGILGLSRRPLSFISQTSGTFGGIFSYCLPGSSSSTGELTFGSQGIGPSVVYTPMLKNSQAPGLYFVELTGISVGGIMLPVPSTVFSTGGMVIDSGTVITRLPIVAYEALRSAFREAMAEYTMGEPLGQLLDTCYDLTGRSNVRVPVVALHLGGGVVLKLGVAGILFLGGVEHVCLAFAPTSESSDVGVIGNTQQRTMQVVYDVGGSRIGFGAGSCTSV